MDSSAQPPDQPATERMARIPKPWQWLVLLTISALFAGALEYMYRPAIVRIYQRLAKG